MSHVEQRLREIGEELLQIAQALPEPAPAPTRTPLEERATEQLRRDEGEIFTAYQDSLGYWTIGIGVLIDKRRGGGITREESEYLFINRLRARMADLDALLPWWRTLDEPRQGVLLNMSYQMGVLGLMGFVNTLKMIRAGAYMDAADAMLKSKWASQTPERARRLSEQMREGEYR